MNDGAKKSGLAALAGVGAAYAVVRYLASKEQEECKKLFPGASQSLLEAMAGAISNPVEDANLGALTMFDAIAKWETAGVLSPQLNADFYAWWNGLSDEQTAALKKAEPKAVICAARQTGSQLADGTSYVLAALAGFVVFEVVRDLEGA